MIFFFLFISVCEKINLILFYFVHTINYYSIFGVWNVSFFSSSNGALYFSLSLNKNNQNNNEPSNKSKGEINEVSMKVNLYNTNTNYNNFFYSRKATYSILGNSNAWKLSHSIIFFTKQCPFSCRNNFLFSYLLCFWRLFIKFRVTLSFIFKFN